VTSIQPELWVDRAAEAVAFYQAAFGAIVLHRVGGGEDIVAQLAIGDAAFWVARAASAAAVARDPPFGAAAGSGSGGVTAAQIRSIWRARPALPISARSCL
jgi:PhnB protein